MIYYMSLMAKILFGELYYDESGVITIKVSTVQPGELFATLPGYEDDIVIIARHLYDPNGGIPLSIM